MITSVENPRIQAVRALHERSERQRRREYLVEGVTLVLEALAAAIAPAIVLRDDGRLTPTQRTRLDVALAPWSSRVTQVSTAALRAAATTESPQGVLAVLPLPASTTWSLGPGDLVVIADRLSDPGNLGTLLRAAAAAGARGLATTIGTVDLFGPKVVRAAMGAHFRLALAGDRDWAQIRALIGGDRPLFGAAAAGGLVYDRVDWSAGAGLVIGNETSGLSPAARQAVAELVTIPLAGGVESLNAAMAGTVILFEAARQRRRAHPADGRGEGRRPGA